MGNMLSTVPPLPSALSQDAVDALRERTPFDEREVGAAPVSSPFQTLSPSRGVCGCGGYVGIAAGVFVSLPFETR